MRIALVTGRRLAELAEAADAPLVEELVGRGVEVARPAWDDPDVDWAGFDAAVVRTTWDYAPRRDTFVAWARSTAAATLLLNPADVLRWNTHKSYLLELEERGAPVVPTAWLGRGDRIDLAELLARRGWSRAVVKPAVGASASGLVRVDASDAAGARGGQQHLDALLAVGDALVQPYLDAVEAAEVGHGGAVAGDASGRPGGGGPATGEPVGGELSVVVVEGEVSHAVRKRPAPGEFRVQPSFGGRAAPVEPDRDTAALARWIVEATGVDLLYARVDLVPDATGALQLLELEATEPNLYLTVVPEAAARVADAILRRAGS